MSPHEYWTRADANTRADALAWYPQANAWVHETAREYNVTPELVCGLLAVLSPGCPWDGNKRDVRGVLRWGFKAYTPQTWGHNVDKARRLVRGESFADVCSYRTSPKVWSFRDNIADPLGSRAVTVDRWIARMHKGRDSITPRQYADIEGLYQGAADGLSIPPNALQACVWIQARNSNKLQLGLPF